MTIRVLVVGPFPPPYHGISVMTKETVDGFRSLSTSVTTVDTADRRGIENVGRLELGNVLLGLRHAIQVWRAALRYRPHITIFPISQAALPFLRDTLWLLGPMLTGSKIVLHLNGSYFGTFYRNAPAPVRTLVRFVGRRTWRALVLAPSATGNFAGLVPTERIRIVPNAVPDISPLQPQEGTERFRVLYLGNLVRTKGYLDVLTAARFLTDIPYLEIAVAGEWFDARAEGQRLLAEPGIRDKIRFLGVVTGQAKQDLLAQSDLMVFPTYYPFEGQPLVLLEAMAAGLPLITTAHGYIPETVKEGRNALFVPPRDPEALARAIRALWKEPDRRRSMGSASRELYLERYTPASFRQHLATMIAELEGTEKPNRSNQEKV